MTNHKMKLIPITYHNKKYPNNIISNIDEIAGHLDKININPKRSYSLHTEYSHMQRKLNSKLLEKYPNLKANHKDNIPQLWKNKIWAKEFANFLIELIGNNKAPEIIEIHPPFDDYCTNFNDFFNSYEEFEKIINSKFPSTKIFLENRSGTLYKKGKFLISNTNSILEFLKILKTKKLKLKLVLDYPQVFSAEKIKMDDIQLNKILNFNNEIKEYINYIEGFHIWGKRKNSNDKRWIPHTGTLNTFFSYNIKQKQEFLKSILETFSDNKSRYLVPEVNSSEEDLQSIILDLINVGFTFPITNSINTEKTKYKQIVSIEWIEGIPWFNIFDTATQDFYLKEVYKINKIEKGNNKRCIGYKDLKTRKYIPCKNKNIVDEKNLQCFECKNLDQFSYCVMCKGNDCRNNSEEALNRCKNEHYIYLAYFNKNKIKVGTAFYDRKDKRLYEQGAPIALIIAKCPTGKIAREIEHKIVEMGFSETVTINYKVKNLILDNTLENIINILNNNLNIIKKQLDDKNKKYLINYEIFNNIEKFDKIKEYLSKNLTIQTSLFDDEIIDLKLEKYSSFYSQKVLEIIGNIALIKTNNTYEYINLKELIGWEINKIE